LDITLTTEHITSMYGRWIDDRLVLDRVLKLSFEKLYGLRCYNTACNTIKRTNEPTHNTITMVKNTTGYSIHTNNTDISDTVEKYSYCQYDWDDDQ